MQICANKVKRYRQANSWSQELLAKASGLSLRTIQRVEKESNASSETLLALSAAFNTSPNELCIVSSDLDVNWKWRNIMQSALALLVVLGAVIMLFVLGGDLAMFADYYTGLFLFLFMYACTVIAFGSGDLVKSIAGLRFIFSNDITPTPASNLLSKILKKQIYFLYGGALIGLLTGSISIHSNMDNIESNVGFHAAYAVNLLIVLYAAIFAEGILRPLAVKLEQVKNA